MAIARVGGTANTSFNGSISSTAAPAYTVTAVGALLVLTIGSSPSGASGSGRIANVTDNQSNTWYFVQSCANPGNTDGLSACIAWTIAGAAASTTVTVTFDTADAKYGTLEVSEYSGAATSDPQDLLIKHAYANVVREFSTGTAWLMPEILPSEDNEMVVCCFVADGSGGTTWSGTTGFTLRLNNADSGTTCACRSGFKVQTTASLEQIWTQAASKNSIMYGLALAFKALGPTINTQPSEQTAYNGATANFSVSATASSGSLTYQWQYSDDGCLTWSNVSGGSGGTTSSYTTETTTHSMDGRYYRCRVTDSNNTVNTRPARLLVVAQPSITDIAA